MPSPRANLHLRRSRTIFRIPSRSRKSMVGSLPASVEREVFLDDSSPKDIKLVTAIAIPLSCAESPTVTVGNALRNASMTRRFMSSKLTG